MAVIQIEEAVLQQLIKAALAEQQQQFNREVLDRMIKMETKMDIIVVQCPQCQASVNQLKIDQAKTEAKAASAHHRIDGVYKTAGAISTAIGLLINGMAFLISQAVKVKGG